jgi:nucleoside-diphosphate-sugar epimerase
MTVNHVVLGTGAIGRAIMEELVRRGESVRMVNRSGRMDKHLPGWRSSPQIFTILPRSKK